MREGGRERKREEREGGRAGEREKEIQFTERIYVFGMGRYMSKYM